MNLTPFRHHRGGSQPCYKNIPIEFLKDAKAEARRLWNARIVVRYRGTRSHPDDLRSRAARAARHQDCLKQYANRFSIYVR